MLRPSLVTGQNWHGNDHRGHSTLAMLNYGVLLTTNGTNNRMAQMRIYSCNSFICVIKNCNVMVNLTLSNYMRM